MVIIFLVHLEATYPGVFVTFFVSVLLISIWLGVVAASKWANEKFQEVGCLFLLRFSLDGRPLYIPWLLFSTSTSSSFASLSKARIYRLVFFLVVGWLCLSLSDVFACFGVHRLATQHNSPHQTSVYSAASGIRGVINHPLEFSFGWRGINPIL